MFRIFVIYITLHNIITLHLVVLMSLPCQFTCLSLFLIVGR